MLQKGLDNIFCLSLKLSCQVWAGQDQHHHSLMAFAHQHHTMHIFLIQTYSSWIFTLLCPYEDLPWLVFFWLFLLCRGQKVPPSHHSDRAHPSNPAMTKPIFWFQIDNCAKNVFCTLYFWVKETETSWPLYNVGFHVHKNCSIGREVKKTFTKAVNW